MNAKKIIKTHFKINKDGITFCPYLIWDEKTKAKIYISKKLWLEVCKEFLDNKEFYEL